MKSRRDGELPPFTGGIFEVLPGPSPCTRKPPDKNETRSSIIRTFGPINQALALNFPARFVSDSSCRKSAVQPGVPRFPFSARVLTITARPRGDAKAARSGCGMVVVCSFERGPPYVFSC